MIVLRLFVPYLAKNIDLKIEKEREGDFKSGDKIILKDEDNLLESTLISIFSDSEKLKSDQKYSFVRQANFIDLDKIEKIKEKEKEFFEVFKNEILKEKEKLEAISSNLTFDEKVVLFTFTAENRIDFRELVKNLAGKLKKRINLKHIGARDRAQQVGGLGVCGQELCCSRFLKTLAPVTIDSVKTQDLIYKTGDVLSGACGKLKCCLNYEVKQYQELKKTLPRIGSEVVFNSEKKGIVIGVDVFSQKIKIKTKFKVEIFEYSEVKDLVKNKNGS